MNGKNFLSMLLIHNTSSRWPLSSSTVIQNVNSSSQQSYNRREHCFQREWRSNFTVDRQLMSQSHRPRGSLDRAVRGSFQVTWVTPLWHPLQALLIRLRPCYSFRSLELSLSVVLAVWNLTRSVGKQQYKCTTERPLPDASSTTILAFSFSLVSAALQGNAG